MPRYVPGWVQQGLDYARRNLEPDAVLGRIEAEMLSGR